MATGAELATAWIRLVPTFEGVQGEVTKGLSGVEDEADKVGDRAGKKLSSGMSKSMKVGLTTASVAILAGVGKLFQVGIEEFKLGEQVSAQTDQIIKNTGAAFDTKFIEAYTLKLSQMSGISEEDLQAAGNSVLKFGDVSKENFTKAVNSINDLAASGKDVKGVGEALGKALADPEKAAGLLKRQGVLLNDTQKELIASFTAAGDKAGAQGVILDALEQSYGGMAEAAGETTTGKLAKLGNTFENLAATAVEVLLPAITGIVDGLAGFFAFLTANPELVTALAVGLGILTLAILATTAAMWALSLTPVAITIALIVVAIAALIAAVIFLVMNWDLVVKELTALWQGFVNWIIAVINGFVGWWNGVWAGFAGWITDLWNSFTGFIKAIFIAYISFILSLVAGFVGAWNGYWSAVGALIQAIWSGFTSAVRGIWQGFVGFIMGAVAGFVGWWNGVWAGIGSVIQSVFSGIGSFIGGVWDGIVGTIRRSVNTIIGIINGAIGAINGIASAVGGLVGLDIKLPKIPGLATGGTVTGSGTVLVGERGPELLHLPKGASVDPDIEHYGRKGGVTFNNYAPLGQSPAQALSQFANRAGSL